MPTVHVLPRQEELHTLLFSHEAKKIFNVPQLLRSEKLPAAAAVRAVLAANFHFLFDPPTGPLKAEVLGKWGPILGKWGNFGGASGSKYKSIVEVV